ncbi:transcription factor FAMA [Dorcoceras hygrometricum]|uniref:Transcription factor FAMA n=1 Tax=Dorcoceras hygrometricum TaxID=472368 RepID=A0A2Z7B3L2_9LAMI|nr:transcription factor FAMA [Dorcoceras hygrometricum]
MCDARPPAGARPRARAALTCAIVRRSWGAQPRPAAHPCSDIAHQQAGHHRAERRSSSGHLARRKRPTSSRDVRQARTSRATSGDQQRNGLHIYAQHRSNSGAIQRPTHVRQARLAHMHHARSRARRGAAMRGGAVAFFEEFSFDFDLKFEIQIQ